MKLHVVSPVCTYDLFSHVNLPCVLVPPHAFVVLLALQTIVLSIVWEARQYEVSGTRHVWARKCKAKVVNTL